MSAETILRIMASCASRRSVSLRAWVRRADIASRQATRRTMIPGESRSSRVWSKSRRRNNLGGSSRRRFGRPIEALAHFLAGLEEWHRFLLHRHMRAGARVAPGARRPVLHRKGAEAAQLDAVAARHRRHDLIEDRVDDVLHVALVEMGVLRSDARHQLGFDHGRPPTPQGRSSYL